MWRRAGDGVGSRVKRRGDAHDRGESLDLPGQGLLDAGQVPPDRRGRVGQVNEPVPVLGHEHEADEPDVRLAVGLVQRPGQPLPPGVVGRQGKPAVAREGQLAQVPRLVDRTGPLPTSHRRSPPRTPTRSSPGTGRASATPPWAGPGPKSPSDPPHTRGRRASRLCRPPREVCEPMPERDPPPIATRRLRPSPRRLRPTPRLRAPTQRTPSGDRRPVTDRRRCALDRKRP